MTEKEERILIIKLKQKPCDSCNVERGCTGSCILESKWYSSMTRQEAIERMAKAICRSGCNECIGDCGSCDLWQTGTEKDYAEAALNAIAPMIPQEDNNER